METPDSIREFWFGTHADDAAVIARQSKLWWAKHEETDRLMRQRFEACVEQAAAGRLDAWLATPAGRLALILLTDQFPRNIYRDTSRAFAFDDLARGWCMEGLEQGVDRSLRPIERVFFYLPLEHVESLADQERAVALYRQLLDDLEPRLRPDFAGYLDYAIRHRDVIARFGRFPHRNPILGRDSSAQELAFLAQPGSSF